MQPQRRQVSLSSGELTYFVAGAGRPILYLHPAGGVRWTRVLERLAESFALHVPVMPGFDGTGAHGAVKSMRGLAQLVGEFIEKLIAGPCDVIGCSFGGYLAAWLAAEHSDRVDHLVLECPAGFRSKGKGERPADGEALRKLLFLHPEKLPPESKPVEQEVANRKMLPHYGYTPDTDEELLARLPSIDKLTLILHGTADRMIPKESVQLLKSRLPRSYLVYIWDAAHAIEVDQPERMLAVLGSFLERSEGFMVNWGTLAVNPG
jgi:pimeloyl-ACP methyl ester carboxylesterase